MGVKVESMLNSGLVVADGLLLISQRSMQQVTERLDRLISQIKEVQRPYICAGKPADIFLVRLCLPLFSPPQSFPQLYPQRLRDEKCRSHMASSFAVLRSAGSAYRSITILQ